MTYLFKLTRRLAHSRVFEAVLVAGIAACSSGDGSVTAPDSSVVQRRSSGSTVTKVVVNPSSASGSVGQSAQFSATAYNSAGGVISGVIASWSSADTTIVSITSSGLATAVRAGTTTITATMNGVRGQATATVTGGTQTVTNPGAVTDLAVATIADTTATISFTQVNDGTGLPANYELRYAIAPISWGAATSVVHGTCTTPIAGTAIGMKLSCTVNGLSPSTAYNFQIVAFRGTLNVNAVFGAISASAAGTTTSGSTITPPPPPPANVFFQESFDDANLGARGWYDNTGLLITTSEHTGSAGSSAQFHFLAGATTPTSGGAIRHKFPASNSMYVAYDVKYSTNWVGSAHTYHPHEFYALSTWDADYDGLSNDWLTLYLEENYQNGGIPRMSMQDNKAINSALGALPINVVSLTENRSTAGCNGMVEANMGWECWNGPPWYNLKQLNGPVVFQPNPGAGYKNNWNHVEAYYQLNTIVNGVGQANGVMQYWFNGTLIIDRHDILFITGARAGLQLSQFVIAPYIGDGSPVDQSMWVDNITVAAARGTP
jgi:hypothetical protein